MKTALGQPGAVLFDGGAAMGYKHKQLPIEEPIRWRDWVDLLETLLIYRIPRLSREEIRVMLNIWNTALKDTRFYREVFAEGRQEENIRLVLRQLRRCFGEVDGFLTFRNQEISSSLAYRRRQGASQAKKALMEDTAEISRSQVWQ